MQTAHEMTAPRMTLAGSTYLLTRRTVRRHHLFAPDPRIRSIFLYCLAVAAQRTGVQVHLVVLMSTHPHLVVTDVEGRLPEFLHYLNRHVALAVKVVRQWEGSVWDHEPPSVVELCTPEAVVEKCGYSIVNPVMAGLVRNAAEWPGVTTRVADLGTAAWRIERPEQYFTANDEIWPPSVELRLTLPRASEQLGGDEQFRALVAAEVAAQEDVARRAVRARGVAFHGPDRCSRMSPYRRASSQEPVRDRNPTFAVGRGNRPAFIHASRRVRAFRGAYRDRLEAWRSGERTAPFPAGTWLMRRGHGAPVEQSAPSI